MHISFIQILPHSKCLLHTLAMLCVHIFKWSYIQNFYTNWPISGAYFLYSNAHVFKSKKNTILPCLCKYHIFKFPQIQNVLYNLAHALCLSDIFNCPYIQNPIHINLFYLVHVIFWNAHTLKIAYAQIDPYPVHIIHSKSIPHKLTCIWRMSHIQMLMHAKSYANWPMFCAYHMH